jgi:nucleotide-binding universal stress UspA family protein
MSTQNALAVDESLKSSAQVIQRAAAVQERVLCATDLSPRSERAVARSVLLANELGAQLVLLHVATPGQQMDTPGCQGVQLAQQLRTLRVQPHREAAIRLHTGEYLPGIAAAAQETEAKLIVLGSQGRKPLASLIGTTAEQLVRLARRPVLIVNRAPSTRYDAVVVAAEFSDASREVIRTAASLRLLEARSVAVVHGFESPYRGPLYAAGFDLRAAQRNIEEWERAACKKMLQYFDAAGVESARFRLVFQQSRPLRAIQKVIRSVRPELLIVGTSERSILNRMMRGSVANDSLRSIECDILVAPPGTRAAELLH